ncbi:hypothetical protein MVEN_00347600 [Mycena venus]|uniref:Uncharacterized protein n=1 Tax=Mycena venus TaxID=2733690 RepID=A0A8H6YTV7_9AGAR|nr:hypothetical protein MVEN_00347600 [Mycena venus]
MLTHFTRSITTRTARYLSSSVPALMREELEQRLKADFPTLFELGCSCDIDDGWEPLLRRLCVDIHHEKTLHFMQIKEKFGGLRAYTNGCSDEVMKRVDAAEEESFWTCERCGKDGQLASANSGWLFTTCQDCLDLRIANGRSCTWVNRNRDES